MADMPEGVGMEGTAGEHHRPGSGRHRQSRNSLDVMGGGVAIVIRRKSGRWDQGTKRTGGKSRMVCRPGGAAKMDGAV